MPGSDFLLTTWQGGGNVPPELGLARRLIGAGHRVRVLSEPTVEPDARAVGCSFTPWPTAPSIAAIDRDNRSHQGLARAQPGRARAPDGE